MLTWITMSDETGYQAVGYGGKVYRITRTKSGRFQVDAAGRADTLKATKAAAQAADDNARRVDEDDAIAAEHEANVVKPAFDTSPADDDIYGTPAAQAQLVAAKQTGGQHGPSPLDGTEADAAVVLDAVQASQPPRETGLSPVARPHVVGSGNAIYAEPAKPSVLANLSNRPKDTAPHLIVEARAGTGKTTTLVEALKRLKGCPTPGFVPSPQQQAVFDAVELSRGLASSVMFVAFNKSIAEELKQRVPAGCEASTMHGLGFKAVNQAFRGLRVNQHRVSDLIGELLGRDVRDLRRERPTLVQATEKLVGLCKMNLTATTSQEYNEKQAAFIEAAVKGGASEEWIPGIDEARNYWENTLDQLAAHYDVDLDKDRAEVFALVPRVLERCKDVEADKSLNFDDMIWLPVALDLPVAKYDILLVDECLPSWTPVMMEDGESKEIKDIVVGDRVRSYDTATGRAKSCVVSATQKIPNQKPLVKIRAKHNHKTAGNRKANFVVCTTDHKIWTVNRGWVQAGDVQIGDTVIVETAAKTTQKGKIAAAGRDKLSTIHVGNTKGTGATPTATAEQFNKIKGGNGHGLTTPQELLLNALGDGWEPEFVVATGGREVGGLPTHYKIDVANPEYMVAVEIDGGSHRGRENEDRKKDDFLRSRGWTVFRVKNRDLARDFADVLQDVCPDGTRCPMPATVESVEETYITEHYVYDITVENCHNFYANGILVHNCQDLNRCQQALAKKAGRRLVLCGDPKQAIYGFAGADSESMPRMLAELKATDRGCTLLPLTVTRRCGKAIVREAQRIVPDFAAFETNPEGRVSTSRMEGDAVVPVDQVYRRLVQDGDMVLCRVNAPLVKECFRFLKAGRKANIQGRDVGQGLISTVTKMKAVSIPDLITRLGAWLDQETAKELAKKNPSDARIEALQDRYDCLLCFTDGAATVEDVVRKIESVFTDDKAAKGVRLSSVHKAKGLEAHQVFILQGKGCTGGGKRKDGKEKPAWEAEQERNLRYVAITRAIESLVYVS